MVKPLREAVALTRACCRVVGAAAHHAWLRKQSKNSILVKYLIVLTIIPLMAVLVKGSNWYERWSSRHLDGRREKC